MDKTPLELHADFADALNKLEHSKEHFFITGRAGTGKSTLLHLFKNTTRKKVVVLAPTGVAALNVGGQTIHSFFNFPGRMFQESDVRMARDKRIYRKLEVLIIDEISMVRADLIDRMDYFLRINRDSALPFGGVQVVFFGDLFQLPPVVSSPEEIEYFRTHYDSPYYFSAKVFQQFRGFTMETIELQKVYRQEARRFVRLLDAVRMREMDFEDLEELNERFEPNFSEDSMYITLSTRNMVVDRINESRLLALASENFSYLAEISGAFDPKQFPTESFLQLKLGAQVMFVKNEPAKGFVNGTIGKVVNINANRICVEIPVVNGESKLVEVEKSEWEIIKYKLDDAQSKIESNVVGTFKQYPLKLAWAMTIHKSQGKTFDRVIIDFGGGAFEHGQTYVALSRCRTLEGIVLKQKIRPQDIIVDDRILEFYGV
jgi:ATP-dependent DNA helicase PIF1